MVDDRRQGRSGEGHAVERVKSFEFLGPHVTGPFTDSVVKKEHQHLFKPQEAGEIWRGPMRSLTNYRRIIESTPLPGTATAPRATAGLSRRWCGQSNASPGAHCLSSRTPSAPVVTGRPRRSSRTSRVTPEACSPRYHPEGEVSTGASKLGPED